MSSVDAGWQGKTGGGNFGQWFLLTVLAKVRVCFLYPVLYGVVPFYLLLSRKGYRAMYFYFRHRHGKTAWEAFCCTWKNHLVFGRIVLDKFALFAGNTQQFYVHFSENEQFVEQLRCPKGFIIVGAHAGNFELAGLRLRLQGRTVNSVVFAREAPLLQRKRKKIYRNFEMNMIEIRQDMSHLFAIKAALERGDVICILCDRLAGSLKSFTYPLLGASAVFPAGIFLLAAQLNVNIFAAFVMKEKGLHYRMHLQPLQAKPDAGSIKRQAEILAHQYVAVLEDMLKQYPLQWFNYYDFWNK
jgi:predicted LPLAT superfamily acyltransferase